MGCAMRQTPITDQKVRPTGILWNGIRDELDLWSAAGKTVRLWLRDDDAIEPTGQLDRLILLSGRFDAPVLLAVVPMRAEPSLVRRLVASAELRPCQHGFLHRNHATPERKAEFGPQRVLEAMVEEIAGGWLRLQDLFGERAHRVFVPPWNRIDPALVARLPEIGFRGLSSIRTVSILSVAGLATVNSDLDVIDWKGGRVGRAHDELVDELHAMLREKREAGESSATLGVLMHHLVHDETAWEFMADLLTVMRHHPAVAMADPADLFASSAAMTGTAD